MTIMHSTSIFFHTTVTITEINNVLLSVDFLNVNGPLVCSNVLLKQWSLCLSSKTVLPYNTPHSRVMLHIGVTYT